MTVNSSCDTTYMQVSGTEHDQLQDRDLEGCLPAFYKSTAGTILS